MANQETNRTAQSRITHRLPINVDLLAVGIGLALAVLIRLGIIHQISFNLRRYGARATRRSRPPTIRRQPSNVHADHPDATRRRGPAQAHEPGRHAARHRVALRNRIAGKVNGGRRRLLRTQYHLSFPQIEYVLWAILVGLIVSNTLGVAAVFRPGVATYELWLKLGIVLVGARFLLQDVLHIGGLSLLLVAVELVLSLSVMTLLGRIFRLRPKLTSLLAIGSSICGVTAIMAAQGAIEPDEEDTSTAIAAILTLGAIALVAFPAIGHLLHMGQQAYGMWAGLAVDNTAESVATGALYGQDAGRWTILAKTARSSFIGFVVLGYAVYWASRRPGRGGGAQGFVPVAEVSQVHPWLPRDFRSGDRGILHQGAAEQPGQPVAMGLPACIRRGWIAHEHEGPGWPGLATAGRGRAGRGVHRHHHAGPGFLELQPRGHAMTSTASSPPHASVVAVSENTPPHARPNLIQSFHAANPRAPTSQENTHDPQHPPSTVHYCLSFLRPALFDPGHSQELLGPGGQRDYHRDRHRP